MLISENVLEAEHGERICVCFFFTGESHVQCCGVGPRARFPAHSFPGWLLVSGPFGLRISVLAVGLCLEEATRSTSETLVTWGEESGGEQSWPSPNMPLWDIGCFRRNSENPVDVSSVTADKGRLRLSGCLSPLPYLACLHYQVEKVGT